MVVMAKTNGCIGVACRADSYTVSPKIKFLTSSIKRCDIVLYLLHHLLGLHQCILRRASRSGHTRDQIMAPSGRRQNVTWKPRRRAYCMASQRTELLTQTAEWPRSGYCTKVIFARRRGFDFPSMKLARMDGHAQPWTGDRGLA